VARIIARRVLAIFGELHAEAFEGAAVQAAKKTFDNGARAQFHAGNLRENLRIEEAQLRIHDRIKDKKCQNDLSQNY
jgi:hypothetical protein